MKIIKNNSRQTKNTSLEVRHIKKTLTCFALAIILVSNISESVVFASDNTESSNPKVAASSNDSVNNIIDVENKKYEIACDKTLQRNLGLLANTYGFGWSGGTRTPHAGEDFDVSKEGENYVIKAHYNKNDPYANGYRASDRLKITLSNFRYTVDPHSINFGTPIVKNFEPKSIDTVTVKNYRDASDDVTLNMQYSQADSNQHTSSYKFSEGLKLGTKFKLKVPFVGETENTAEFSFGAEQGWTDASTESVNKTLSASVNCKNVQPNYQSEIEALLATSQCDVPYTATAEMVFDVSFEGFLAWSGNAAGDSNRPTVKKTFGNGDETAVEAISRLYQHKDIVGYDSDIKNVNQRYVWDWSWMQKKYGGDLEGLVDSIQNQKFTFGLSGTFTKISGNNIIIKTLKDEPIIEPKLSNGLIVSRKASSLLQLQAKSASGNPISIENSKQDIPKGNIKISCDNKYELYVNGKMVGTGQNWITPQDYLDLPLVHGKNVIAVKGMDQGGVAALVADASLGGKKIITDNNWKVSTSEQSGWSTSDFDDSGWNKATDFGAARIVSPWGACLNGFAPDTRAHWIWTANNDKDDTVYFRTTVDIP